MKTLIASLIVVAHFSALPVACAAEPPQMPSFHSTPEIVVDHEITDREGIRLNIVYSSIQTFLETHEQFTLVELQGLAIPT